MADLVILHGPPASGKFTTATMGELCKLEALRETLARKNYSAIPHESCMAIDSGTHTEQCNAMKIARHFDFAD